MLFINPFFVTIIDVPAIHDLFIIFFVFLVSFIFLYVIFSGIKFDSKSPFSHFFPVKSNIAAIIAVVLSFILVFTRDTKTLLTNIIPWLVFGILLFVFFVLFFELFNIDIFSNSFLGNEGRKVVAYVILAFLLFVIFWNVGIVFNHNFMDAANHSNNMDYLTGKHGFVNMAFSIIYNPKVFSAVIFLIVAAIVVFMLTNDSK